MKRSALLAFLPAVAFLAGCAASSPAGQAIVKTVSLTDADLKAGQAVFAGAEATDPAAVEGATCYGWMDSELPAIQAALAPATGGLSTPAAGSGVFTIFADGSVAFDTVQNGIQQAKGGLPPALRLAFEQNCGPYVAHVVGGIGWLIQQVGTGVVNGASGGILAPLTAIVNQ